MRGADAIADTSVKVTFLGDAKKLKSTIDDVEKDIGGLGTKSKSFGDKFTDGFQKALPLLAGVGAGVAVIGSALKAAIEDEAEQKKLSQTLIAVAGATKEQIAATEKWIDTTQRATGVSDSQLRPALDKLVRSSSSLEDAQKNLSIAMDVSRGTGKDLDTVAQALAKVLEGNIGAAARLVPELTGIAKEGATADEAMAALAKTFGGQTAIHADTAAGKMERINVAFNEMKERLGAALLPKLTEFGDWMLTTGIPKMEEMATNVSLWWEKQDGLRKAIGTTVDFIEAEVKGLQILIGWVKELASWIDHIDKWTTKWLGGGGGQSKILTDLQNRAGFGDPLTTGGETFIPGRASGGPAMAGRPYWVGERGRELFVPDRNGTVVANGGGGTQSITLNIDGRSFMSWLVDYSRDAGGIPITTRAPS